MRGYKRRRGKGFFSRFENRSAVFWLILINVVVYFMEDLS